jgi:hypothetical protein
MFPKTTYVRSKAILEGCRRLACQHCGAQDGSVISAHSNWSDLGGKGRSIKACDRYVAALCHICHHQLDAGFLWDREQKRRIWIAAWKKTIPALVTIGAWPLGVPVPDLGVEA